MTGAPVFLREVLAVARRPRTYVFQSIFLGLLVLCLIPLWPSSGRARSGAEVADTGRLIFEWGGYLQVILLALLVPATTANAITQEKQKNTLDILLLTGAGPFAIVWGKFFSRLFNLAFLLFLTVPLLFALLTLGGVAGSSILIEFTILVGFAVFGSGLGVFLSTVLPKPTSVVIAGYVLLAGLLTLPVALEGFGVVSAGGATYALPSAHISPLHDLIYLFHPSWFVTTQSFPADWWVFPAWSSAAGLGLTLVAGLLLPYARTIERVLSVRRLLEAFDRGTYDLLHPRRLIARLRGRAAAGDGATDQRPPPIGERNPIYWKETSINTVGRFRTWWRVNLLVLLLMGGTYLVFLPQLSDISFHKYMVAAVAGLIVLLSTVIAATTVSQEREDGSLVLLATTPVECAVYTKGKVLGIARNIVFLVALPFVHVVLFVALGVIHPVSMLFLAIAIPIAVISSIVQAVFISLLFPTTLRAIMAAVVVVIVGATLPAVCCLPTFNLPVACYYLVEPVAGLGTGLGATGGSQGNYLVAMALAIVFSAGTQVGYVVVVYSLIRSGFDRYIGRAA